MSNEYLRQSDLLALNTLSPEEDAEMRYAERLADRGGESPVSLQEEIRRAPNQKARDILLAEAAQRGGDYEQLQTPAPVKRRSNDWRAAIRESLGDGEMPDGPSFDEMLNGFKPEAAAKPVDTSTWGNVKRGFMVATEQMPQLAYGLAAFGASGLETMLGEGGISSAAKNWAVGKYQDWGAKIQANSSENDEFTTAYDKAKSGDFGALVDWLSYGVGYTLSQGAQMLATGGVGSLAGKAALKGSAEKLASGMVAKEAATLAAGKEVTEEITKAAVANVSSRLGQMGAIGAAAYGMEGGEIGGDLASMSAKEGRALTGAELARGLGATVLAGSLEFVGDKLGYDTILGKNKFGLGDVAGIKGKAARAVAGTVANVPAEFGTEYFQTGAENWGKGEEENILPFNQSEKAQMDALNSGALGAVGGAVHGVIGGAISRARNVDEAIDAANQELATGAQVSDAAKEADDALKSLQSGIADTRQIEDGVPAMADRAREMGMLEPQQRLLGYQAGEPLITFPDGTTMTRADYARTQMDADQARLDAMVQPAPLPGMMARAQEQAQPIIDKAELDDLIAQERRDREARLSETLSSQRSTKVDQALSGDSAQDDLIPSQPQPVNRMVSAPQAIEQVTQQPVAQPQAPQQSEAIQKLQAKYDAAQEMGDSTMVRILSNEIKAAKLKEAKAAQPQPAQPVTPKAEQVFAMGSLPTNAEPITVKDGVVHVGNYPAQNFETGDDVTVPEGASKAQIAKALKDAGAIAKGQRVFGVLTETNATGPSEKAKEISRLIGEMGVLGWDAARVQRLIDEKGEAAADKTIASFKEHIASTNRLKNYDKHGGESVAARAEQPTQSAPTSGKAGGEQWSIRPYRYAKDKIAFDITGDGKWKGRLARLSEQVGGRYVNRARAYIMSEKQARKALDLYEKGYDASVFTGKLEAPKEAVATTPAQPGTTTENQSVAETKPSAPIADFGEKIGGARKDVWTSYKDKLGEVSDDEVISEPLSKSWPEPDYQKMLAEGAEAWSVAFMRAARDEIPRKPTATWKQKRWAEQVKTLRSVAMRLVSGDISVEMAKTKLDEMRSAGMKRFASRVELYQLVGHAKSLAGIGFDEHYYSIYKGKDNVHLWVVEQDAKATAFSNWPRELATGSTKEEMLQAFKDKYASLDLGPAKKKAVSFDIYSRKDGGFWIGKKLGRNPLFVAGPFKTVAEARAYRDANNAELIAKLEKNKEIPNERRDTNNPRVGEDMRNGQDVTPQMFGEAFGFRGVEFGNWVEQTKRQKDLNDAYDALMDMAAVLGVPPKALSLNGELGLAFGARGSGGVHPAAAHYERDKVVINLTKKEGAGSLGHEWWHALDNYFQRLRGNKAGMATEALDVSLAARGSEFVANTAMRKEMVAAFGAVVKSIKETALKARSSKLDAKRSKEYWVTGPEMSARSFESYLISKLQDQNASNDYLANIVDDETWAAAEKLGFELEDSYPYPTAGEMPTIRAGFDRFFQAIQTKETDKGIAFYSQARATEKQAGVESKDLAASELSDSVRPVAQALGVISKLLGKNIVYRTNLGGDGMVMDSKTIYLDPERMDGIGAVQVFGHEFWHQVQMSHPEIWNAVVGQLESAGALTDSVMVEQYNDYFALTDDFNSKTEEQIIAELDQPFVDPEGGKHASLRTFLTQELMSDLAGNRFAESEFWTDVFAGLEAKEGHIKATTLIRRFVGALTKMLDKVLSYMKMQGFKADAMLQDHLTEVRSALAEGMAQYLHETQYGNKRVAGRGERRNSESRQSFDAVLDAFEKLTANGEAFSYPKLFDKDMDSIATKIAKEEFDVVEADGDKDLEKAWAVYSKDNTTGEPDAFILQYRDGKLELNVGRMKEGGDGSILYAVAGTYAHNNGLVFSGDRMGITPKGMERRLENMLSLALKFRNTDFLLPHPDMKLDWKNGDYRHNMKVMLERSYENALQRHPWIKDYYYDFDTATFRDNAGNPVALTDAGENDFEGGIQFASETGSGGNSGGYADKPGARYRTEKRGIFLQSVLRETGRSGRREVLGDDGARIAGKVVKDFEGSHYSASRVSHELPAERPSNRPIDRAELEALRRAAARIERPESGTYLHVTEDGQAIATGQKGTRIPDAFRRFAEDNGLTFRAVRKLPKYDRTAFNRSNEGSAKSQAMPEEYRADGARYSAEIGGEDLDRTGLTRFSTARDYTDPKDGLQSFTVLVKQNGQSFRDGVTGPSREAAVKFAQWVWPAAEVEIIADRAFVPDLRYSASRNQRLAPNGKPSNLNEQQWQQVRTPEFKRWFGDWEKYATMQGGVWNDGDGEVSKIVDENGEPLVVYHGSKKGGFTIMRPDKGDKHRSPMIFAAADRSVARTYSGHGDEIDLNTGLYEDDGTYDHQSDDHEEQRGIYSLFLNIRNPNEASFEGANWDGQRYDQYEVWDNENEEPISSKGGRFVMSEDEAMELAESLGDDGRYEARQASDHYETTNSVAEEAKRLGNDGAIIREVVDDGGQYGSADATDVFVFFDSNQAKSATQNTGAFSKTNDDLRYSTARLPDAIIANSLAETKGATYEAAKSGSATAAMKIAKQLVTPDLLNALRPLADDQPIAVGVVSIEATGRNALPQAGAAVIARSLGIEMDLGIVQSSKPKRTGMDGLDRIFARPEFSGDVVAGRGYVLVDDTITQGGTFAALDEHITENGGHVVAVVALTGKQYSSKLSPSEATLRQLRDKFGDIEDGFKQATGYGFDALTESEARYLANFKQADAIRARIAKESGETARRTAAENGLAEEQNQKAPPSGGVSYSTPRIIGDSGRQYDQGQRAAFQRTGRVVNDLTIGEKLAELRKDIGKKLAQGLVDQFAPIKELTSKGYMLARLSKGATGAFEAFMHHGKLSINDGAYDADTSGGVMEKVFYKLGKETSDFLYWVAGNRSERLKMQGKENLFTAEDIAAYKRLSNGTTSFDYTLSNGKTTRDRTLIYKDALAQFNEFNKNVLDMAEQSGMIDGKSRHLWEHEFYVPFYRVMEDEDGAVRGGNIGKGIVRQRAFEKLKGGTDKLGDLLSNTLMNWMHLIDASAKNRAAAETLKAAERLGAARLAVTGEKKTVWFMENGDKVEYKVDDPYLLTAINGLDYAGLRGPMMDILSKTKHWLTMGVTASPFFKVRNLIRDSVQAIATSDLGYNPISNVIDGYKLTNRQRQEYVSALAGGGLIRFGTMLEGNEASRVRQLIKIGAKDEHILDGEGKISQFYDKYLEPAVTAYNEIGNRGEEINRMSLYDQLIKQGKGHAEASLLARDLMDFSMQGSFATIRFLTQVVPFMNARLQGMYKLGRAAKEDPAKMAVVLGAVTMASLALLAMYGDDDDWKKREDWDRDNYWWFKLGGTAFRIPKPFEIGAIATLAERSAEALFDSEMNGERYRKVTSNLILNQLAMNPVPQLVKPIIDIYANKDSFSGRPIETMGMEKLDPSYRFRQNTSMVARGISSAGNAVTGEHFLSPVQVDSAIRGYFSWLGAFVVGAADIAVRSASNEPTKPAVDYWKTATGGMVSDLDSASSRYVSSMYEQAKELEQAYGTYRSLIKEGKTTEAAEYREDNKEKLSKYREVENVKRAEAKLNERIRMIERSNMQADEKRDLINQIRKQQDVVARRVAPGA